MHETDDVGWRVVCFDLDGCLVDSSVAIATSINAALDDLGLPEEAEARLYRFIGPPLESAFGELLASLGGDVSLTPMLVERYRKHYRIASRELTLIFAGIEPMLHELSRRAHLAVVTTKPQPYADNIILGLGLARYFQAGVFGPALDAPQEAKEITLARALRSMQVMPELQADCAMIGDRAHDVAAGKTLGMITVGVTWGIGSRSELTEAGADHLVTTPRALVDLVP